MSLTTTDFSQNFVQRFAALLKIVGANAKPREPALVPAAGVRSQLTCEGFSGGKDVELVLVRARLDSQGSAQALRETLTYRQNVAGSDLVYDLTGEFLQGKARPFDCDLRELPARLYALLPFQVESLSVVAEQQARAVRMEVEFRNALGKRVAGTLPCHAALKAPDGKVAWERSLATSLDGSLTTKA
ncbi:MAG: hypothetical protein IAF94_26230, partial [Pirellulaceae bacterium]|nr:hypothetical protein [Pirellulaceae bacterium]